MSGLHDQNELYFLLLLLGTKEKANSDNKL